MSWRNLALTSALGAGAIACLIPAIEVNLAGHAARGGSPYEAAIFIVSVIAASASAITCGAAIKKRDVSMALVSALILFAALAFNLTNALASSSVTRAQFAEPRADVAARRAALEAERSAILGTLGTASGPSVGELEAELGRNEANLLFSRSKQCREVTLGDSSAHCDARAAILGKIPAAKRREQQNQRLDEIRSALAALPTAPQVIDPKVDSLLAILGGLGWAVDADRARIGLAVDILTALFVELLAAFGPGIFLYMRPDPTKPVSLPTEEVAPAEPTIALVQPIKEAKGPSDLRSFLEQRVIERPGARVSAAELLAAFNDVHADRIKPISSPILGRAVNALYGPKKDPSSKTAVYLGLELLPANAQKLRA